MKWRRVSKIKLYNVFDNLICFYFSSVQPNVTSLVTSGAPAQPPLSQLYSLGVTVAVVYLGDKAPHILGSSGRAFLPLLSKDVCILVCIPSHFANLYLHFCNLGG